MLGEVTGVDAGRREVMLAEARLAFDYLVMATGASHSYFGHDEWKQFAPGLKSIEDATEIRRRILTAFEDAEWEADEVKRAALLNFVIIGGGPTGVELAGKVIEIARHALRLDFRHIDSSVARVVLVEAGDRLLAAFPPALSADAKARLEGLGVDVLLGKPVTECDANGVVIGGVRMPARTIVWAAGVAASPAARWLGLTADRAGRALVSANLDALGHDAIFVIGDTASVKNPDGKVVPGLASAAKQQGTYVANVIKARLRGKGVRPFVYSNMGNLATIGRNAAVVQLSNVQLKGFVAWLFWSLIHIYFLIGFRNRFSAGVDWIWTYLTYERAARLIIGGRSPKTSIE
jgi:NADH dehydrogenase